MSMVRLSGNGKTSNTHGINLSRYANSCIVFISDSSLLGASTIHCDVGRILINSCSLIVFNGRCVSRCKGMSHAGIVSRSVTTVTSRSSCCAALSCLLHTSCLGPP